MHVQVYMLCTWSRRQAEYCFESAVSEERTHWLGARQRGYNKQGCWMHLCKVAHFCAFLRAFAPFCGFLCILSRQNGLQKSANLRRILQKCAKTTFMQYPLSYTPFWCFHGRSRGRLCHALLRLTLHFPNVLCIQACLPTWYQVRSWSIFGGKAAVPGTVPLHTLGGTSQQEPCNTNVPSGLVLLEAQQRYFSYHAIFVAIVSQNSFVLVFMGYRTIIARCVAKQGIALMCLCDTKYQAYPVAMFLPSMQGLFKSRKRKRTRKDK